jgi:hypothetical protein
MSVYIKRTEMSNKWPNATSQTLREAKSNKKQNNQD